MGLLGIPPDILAAFVGGWHFGKVYCDVLGFTMTLVGKLFLNFAYSLNHRQVNGIDR